jgi:hypothetical protein
MHGADSNPFGADGVKHLNFVAINIVAIIIIIIIIIIITLSLTSRGHVVAHLVEALCYKPVGRGLDSRWCH